MAMQSDMMVNQREKKYCKDASAMDQMGTLSFRAGTHTMATASMLSREPIAQNPMPETEKLERR